MLDLFILIESYTNGFYYSILEIVTFGSILCGISVIVTKNPIVSVLFLIGLFFNISLYLMLLGLNFIGLSYLLVYVGAVSILFLFILMLINVRISELVTDNRNSMISAILISILLFTPIATKGNVNAGAEYYFIAKNKLDNIQSFSSTNEAIPYSNLNNDLINDLVLSLTRMYPKDNIYYVTSKGWDSALGEVSHITSIGNVIYTNYPLLLIITSIVLLLAMVGAIIITINKSES